MKAQKYIGITGFMKSSEISELRTSVFAQGKDWRNDKWVLMCGVLVSSSQVVGGELHRPTRYPPLEDLHKIFELRCENQLNFVHYNTRESSLYDELMRIMQYGHNRIDGFQLNMTWPSTFAIERFRKAYPDQKIVLQINNGCLESVRNDTRTLIEHLYHYDNLVDYALFDLSGGRGKELNPAKLLPYIEAVQNWNGSRWGIVVAGGLKSDNLDILKPILAICPDLSIDAEGQLRTKNEDELNIAESHQYLQNASKLLGV